MIAGLKEELKKNSNVKQWHRKSRDEIISTEDNQRDESGIRRLRLRVASATLFTVVAALRRLRPRVASAALSSVVAALRRLRPRDASAALSSVVAALTCPLLLLRLHRLPIKN